MNKIEKLPAMFSFAKKINSSLQVLGNMVVLGKSKVISRGCASHLYGNVNVKRCQLSTDGTLRAGYTVLPRLQVQLLGGYHKFELENRELFLKRQKRINYLQEKLPTLQRL